MDGRGDHPEPRGLPRAPGAGGLRRPPRRRPLAGVERHSQAAARDVPRPPRPDRGAAGGAALRRVQPALRVLRRACGVGQARRRALQRNSRSRNLLTASGSLTWTPTGTARNDPALPVTWARNWPALWLMSTIISVRSSARA